MRARHQQRWPAILLTIALVCGVATAARGQGDVTAEFGPLLAKGRSAFDGSRYEEARQWFERALAAARAAGGLADEGTALLALAGTHFSSSRYVEGKETASRAFDIGVSTNDMSMRGRAHFYLGLIAERLGQAAEALPHYRAAVEDLTDGGGEAGILSSALLQLAYAENDHPVTEPDRFRRSQELAEQAGNKARVGRVLHGWGDRLFAVGENEAAFEKYQLAVATFTDARQPDDLGTIYNSIGRLYRRHGQYEAALEYQKRALRIHETSANPFVHMQSLNAVGVTLQSLGRERESRPYMERALALARQSKNPRAEDFVAANFASSLLVEGVFDEAARLFEGVIERKLDVYPSLRYRDLAESYIGLKKLDQALDAATHAIDICGDQLRDIACPLGYDIRAAVHLARNDRVAALTDLQRALVGIEDARKRLIPADFFKQQFGRTSTTLFGRAIELQLAEGRAVEALETAEQARARAFLDLLGSRTVALTPKAAAALNDNTSRQRSEFTAPSPKIDELTAIAARLRSTLLLYWVTPDRVFIWTVTPNGNVRAATVAIREAKLADLISSTSPFGTPAGGNTGLAANPTAWRSLYDVLIKPVRGWLPTTPGALVTIVPHGPLSMLSFAALQDQRLRYLIEAYTLNYVPAAGILQFTERQRHGAPASSATLVVADPRLPPRSPLDRPLLALPGARDEASAIARLAPRQSVVTLQGELADEASVREKVNGKRVIHFATHAIVSDAEPFSSFLALARTDATPNHDGTLTAQEIYGLQLQADLVVLSACRSGGGKLTGDGMATFARAFLYAGTPSMITSVWDVADESSARLVPEFYRVWRGGTSKARALRAAQLTFLKDLRAGTLKVDTAAGQVVLPEHPALWAGFMLIGEPD